ncbi:hypothetical protein A4S05_32975 [Nostoc sp. KVJ20]|nr:hypothetical protein A4S05_32975 [Nostoc sp. KVJ20]
MYLKPFPFNRTVLSRSPPLDIAYNSRFQFTLHLKILDVAKEHSYLSIAALKIRVSKPPLPIHQTTNTNLM